MNGEFQEDSSQIEQVLHSEIKEQGLSVLLNHLRLCGNIPESYNHDSSHEKLYSKYTDVLLSEAFQFIGLKSNVLLERADAAGVEAFATKYSFVADAKSFRLSRTAKNQKDFKVQAMDGWKRGKPYAMVVCPIYQLPTKGSQIYEQATSRNVLIFTYSHLSVLVALSEASSISENSSVPDQTSNKVPSEELLSEIFKTVSALNPSKDALTYWLAINKVMLGFAEPVSSLWLTEKRAALESIAIAKEEAITFLTSEREKIMRMSHEEALRELVRVNKIENRMRVINSVSDNGILEIK